MTTATLQDLKPSILVVEDNYLTAVTVCDIVRDSGFAVAGPVSRLESGMDLISQKDLRGAIVDINLNGTECYPLCRELARRHVPFVFLTAYPPSSISASFRATPHLAKPVEARQLRTLLSAFGPAAREPQPSPAKSVATGNLLLETLVEDDRRLLEPHLEKVVLQPGEVLQTPDKPPSHVYFPSSGVVSLVSRVGDREVEAALVGREGLVGIAAVMEAPASAHRATVRYQAGEAWRLPAHNLSVLFAESRRLQAHLLRYAHSLLADVSSNFVCAAHGTVTERVAEWLLLASERHGCHEVRATHEEIAGALGVRRAGVTVSLHILEGTRAVRNGRGRVDILDRAALLALSGPRGQA